MNRTLKDATVHTFTYCSHDQLKEHINAYLVDPEILSTINIFSLKELITNIFKIM